MLSNLKSDNLTGFYFQQGGADYSRKHPASSKSSQGGFRLGYFKAMEEVRKKGPAVAYAYTKQPNPYVLGKKYTEDVKKARLSGQKPLQQHTRTFLIDLARKSKVPYQKAEATVQRLIANLNAKGIFNA